MADHYRKSVEILEEVSDVRAELAKLYEEPFLPTPDGWRRPPHVHKRIVTLQQKLGHLLKLGDIHATLSVRQAVMDHATESVSLKFAESGL